MNDAPSVVVDENRGVDERRADGERLADGVAVWSLGAVRHRDADCVSLRAVAADVPQVAFRAHQAEARQGRRRLRQRDGHPLLRDQRVRVVRARHGPGPRSAGGLPALPGPSSKCSNQDSAVARRRSEVRASGYGVFAEVPRGGAFGLRRAIIQSPDIRRTSNTPPARPPFVAANVTRIFPSARAVAAAGGIG